MSTLLQDLRFGLRMLAKNPGFTAVAVITLALGIGANTAIFTLIDAILLRPLPVSDPGELVELWTVVPGHERSLFSYPMASEIAHDSKLFSSVSTWSGPVVPLEVNGESAPGAVSEVGADYFQTLRTRPFIGHLFSQDDFKSGEATFGYSAVISYGFWQAHYGGSPDVLGKTMKVNGHPYTIIGVTPRGFFGPEMGVSFDVWVPLGPPLTPDEMLHNRQDQGYWVTARLRPGVSVAKARLEMQVLWPGILESTIPAQLNGEQREQFLKQRIRVEGAANGIVGMSLIQFEKPLWVLMTGVGLLLLITCVNLASLIVARSASRLHEMGIRVALGATRLRLTRQVMTEGLLLSVGGATLGLPLAYAASGMLARFVWRGWFTIVLNLTPDWRILLFTGAAACLSAVLFSLLPAWQARRQDPSSLMWYRAGMSTRGGRIGKAGRVLIVGQVGLSLVLMEGASLFTRNLAGLRSLNLGFEPDNVLGILLQPMPGGYKNFDSTTYYRTLIDGLARLPGVRSVSLSKPDPISRVNVKLTRPVWRGSDENRAESPVQADEYWVSPEFFRTLGMHMLQGREFSLQDDQHAPAITIVSRSLARRLFPTGDAIGQLITVLGEKGNQSLQIVGVVGDANLLFVRNQRPLAYYMPFFQKPNPMAPYVEIKAYGDPRTVLAAARRQTQAYGREYIFSAETLTEAVNNSLVNDRVLALLSEVFGGLALLLVAIGLYGLVSYSVAGRTAEIGMRMALGAEPAGILRLILSGSLGWIVTGAAVGLPLAFSASRLVSAMLFDLSPTDPVSLVVALATVLGAALLAAYLPARRATKVDPMVALRYE